MPDEEQWRAEAARRYHEAVTEAGAPLFGLATNKQCHRSVGGWGSQGITLRHVWDEGWVEVSTNALERAEEVRVDAALTHFLIGYVGDTQDLSFPFHLTVDRWFASIRVGGQHVDFDVLGIPTHWTAHAVIDGRSVEIRSRGVTSNAVALDVATLATYDQHGYA